MYRRFILVNDIILFTKMMMMMLMENMKILNNRKFNRIYSEEKEKSDFSFNIFQFSSLLSVLIVSAV